MILVTGKLMRLQYALLPISVTTNSIICCGKEEIMYYLICLEELIILCASSIGRSIGNGYHPYRCSIPLRTSAPLVMLLLSIPPFMVMGCGNGSSHESIEQINGRLDTLEEKVTQIETQSAVLKKSVSHLDSFVQALDEKTASLTQRLYEITSKTGIPSSQTQSEFSEGIEGQYHTVVRGETLYSISKKYGLSVSDLLQLNGLKKDQTLKAGQKLLIAPGVY